MNINDIDKEYKLLNSHFTLLDFHFTSDELIKLMVAAQKDETKRVLVRSFWDDNYTWEYLADNFEFFFFSNPNDVDDHMCKWWFAGNLGYKKYICKLNTETTLALGEDKTCEVS